MARRTIFTVGFDLPDVDGFECYSILSDQSLLDSDIVVFRPTLSGLRQFSHEQFQGRQLMTESASFALREKISHWKAQIAAAFDSGKTIVVFLPVKEEVVCYTGERNYSGTGRNRTPSLVVAPVSSYEFLPCRFDEIAPGRGQTMKLAPNSELITTYWNLASSMSCYEVHFKIKAQTLILTKSGDKTVGARIKSKGNLILLPNIHWDDTAFKTKDGERWTKAAERFAFMLRDAILDIDSKLRVDQTPEPEWAKENSFRLVVEGQIELQVLDLTKQIESLIEDREVKRRALRDHASLRALLFEKGKLLESSVRDALTILGFDTSSFKEGDSEFDAIFSSEEGRFIGEVEGKDTKAINVDKFSQLERNIHEDLERDEVTMPAKGVLFGNAHRILPPGERDEHFTQKVLAAATRTGCALVRTPDLFRVARFLKDAPDREFAEECRKAIASTAGAIVTFPVIPEPEQREVAEPD